MIGADELSETVALLEAAANKVETEVIEASHGKMFRKYKDVMDVIKYSQ